MTNTATTTKRTPQGTLILPCDVCGKAVIGRTGYVCVSYDAIHEHERQVEEWEHSDGVQDIGWGKVITGDALFDYPKAAPWRIYHADCDPQPGSNDYSIGVKSCSTYADLLARTAHLLGKSWLESTDWDDFLYRVLAVNGYGR